MALTTEEKENMIREMNSYDYIRFVWSDIHGISRCKSIPRRNTAAVLDNGLDIRTGEKSRLCTNAVSIIKKLVRLLHTLSKILKKYIIMHTQCYNCYYYYLIAKLHQTQC